MFDTSAVHGSLADRQLVLRAAAGEKEAFEIIIRRYKGRIFSYVARMAPNRQDAEDLTQEVFVRAYLALDSLRKVRNLGTWLYRVANNICIDEYRKRDRAPAKVSLHEPLDEADRTRSLELRGMDETPEEALLKDELKAKMAAAIERLAPKLRSAVILFELQSLTYEEIAEIEGCPVGTVKSRLFNARATLRTALAPYLERTAEG